MSRIPSKGTKPEGLVRQYLFSEGFRYRNHVGTLPCSPDVVLSKQKTAIFVHGCFWHGHACPRGKLPATNTEFWHEKINQNKQRDLRNLNELKRAGWHVLVIWQCEISNKQTERLKMNAVCEEIKSYGLPSKQTSRRVLYQSDRQLKRKRGF